MKDRIHECQGVCNPELRKNCTGRDYQDNICYKCLCLSCTRSVCHPSVKKRDQPKKTRLSTIEKTNLINRIMENISRKHSKNSSTHLVVQKALRKLNCQELEQLLTMILGSTNKIQILQGNYHE